MSAWSRTWLEQRVLRTKEEAIAWAQSAGLLLSSVQCRQHRAPMVFYPNRGPFGSFRCPKHAKHRSSEPSEVSAASGSIFEDSKLPLDKVLRLMFEWSCDASYEVTHRETGVSSRTTADWYRAIRESITMAFLQDQDDRGKIGGPGCVVQVDEAKFGRRKYHRGRTIEGHWVLGMIQDGSQDLRLVVCPGNSRTSKTLTPIIVDHVADDTTMGMSIIGSTIKRTLLIQGMVLIPKGSSPVGVRRESSSGTGEYLKKISQTT
ncbi:uncharacterized protein LOC128397685 [Panonychus citri]|uniref:uncharacterized protein LOC128397685 n=1 Tax=Panonychus citri TaxID=50023 RepID=UPI002307C678|nr:uncharacterized protein LOC128397685 [Panonychus citri]